MVLLLNGKILDFNENELKALLYDYSLAQQAYKFHERCKQQIETNNYLIYLHQREMAIIYQLDPAVCFLGTDEATTCHFVVLDCPNAGLIGATHLDGVGTDIFFDEYVSRLRKAIGKANYMRTIKNNRVENPDQMLDIQNQYEVVISMVGGFKDDNNESMKLSCEILKMMHNYQDINFRIDLCCVSELNNSVRNGINYPRHYGMLYNTRIHRMFPAEFNPNAKEPYHVLRSTRFCGPHQVFSVYNPDENKLVLKDFEYKGRQNYNYYRKLAQSSDDILRKYSTSPLQEKDGYAEHIRSIFKFMTHNPDPSTLYETDKASIEYKCSPVTGEWTNCS